MTKIFCIGFNKTGTTSLSRALCILGYKVNPIGLFFNRETGLLDSFLDGQLGPVYDIISRYDAFADRPWNHTDYYKQLDARFENSKFILTIRDVHSWVISYKAFANKIALRSRWFYERVSQQCYGVSDFISDEPTMRSVYECRNREIKKYFADRPDDLLVLDLSCDDKFKLLSSFLNVDEPTVAYPHLRKAVKYT